jgi:predicted transcriptional regulator
MSNKKPSGAEVDILQILWEQQPCSVRTVHDEISKNKAVGYTTVLKQLQRMQEKGLVSRSPGVGKSFNYSAVEAAQKTRGKLFDRLLETAFRGNVNDLVMHALGEAETSSEELDEIKNFIQQLENKTKTGA